MEDPPSSKAFTRKDFGISMAMLVCPEACASEILFGAESELGIQARPL